MPRRERSYRDGQGRLLILRSERRLSSDGESWSLRLILLRGPLRRRIARRELTKDGQWGTSAILLVQAQEELEILREHGVDISIVELL